MNLHFLREYMPKLHCFVIKTCCSMLSFIGSSFIGLSFIALCASINAAYAQSAPINLRLVDLHGKPVPNAVVSIDNVETTQETQSDETNATSGDASLAIMDQVEYQFLPKVLLINKGQKVDFPNSDNVRHHVYSFSESKFFEIKMYKGSDAEPIQFDKAGVVVLGCNIHDSMLGYIYVASNEYAVVTDKDGNATLPQSVSTINIWHPLLSTSSALRVTHTIAAELRQQTVTLNIELPGNMLNEQSSHRDVPNKFKRS